MANSDAPMGFRLIKTAGHEPIRRVREVDSGNGVTIAPGDALTIEADGNVTRAIAGEVNGICEGIVLQGVDQGPVSYQYLPASTAGQVISIEDPTAMFEVQTEAVIPQSGFDSGAMVNIVDAAANTALGQSRQQVGDVGGTQLLLVESIDRPLNERFAADAKVVVQLIPASLA